MENQFKKYKRRTPVGLAKPFNITSVSKLDIISLIVNDAKVNFKLSDVKKLTESDMSSIASKLSDDYVEQLFWGSLKIIVEHHIENKKSNVTKIKNSTI